MSKRQRDDGVETVGVRKVPGALAQSQTEHEYHTETNHVLSRQGTDTCDEDGSLRPGHNACAVCAARHCMDDAGEVVLAVSALIQCNSCRKGQWSSNFVDSRHDSLTCLKSSLQAVLTKHMYVHRPCDLILTQRVTFPVHPPF